ncbi:MAG: superoxide dismutase [Bacteroidia bacterium]|nr:superoxide dismutase [Bacteroidia bacterium]
MKYPFSLPKLKYNSDSLEPFIDTKTMEIHYGKHHQAYIDKLNAAFEKFPEWQSKEINELFSKINLLPADLKNAVQNNGGGHFNHSLFWEILTPEKNTNPDEILMKKIVDTFTSIEKLKENFNKTALSVFGSGWAWLIVDEKKELSITSTSNQDNPLMNLNVIKGYPLFGIDVWEHAYYLKYQNKRAEYLNNIWNIINWKQISENYKNYIK